MAESATLLPPLAQIHERLTANERERRLLRSLERLALRQQQYDHRANPSRSATPAPRTEATR